MFSASHQRNGASESHDVNLYFRVIQLLVVVDIILTKRHLSRLVHVSRQQTRSDGLCAVILQLSNEPDKCVITLNNPYHWDVNKPLNIHPNISSDHETISFYSPFLSLTYSSPSLVRLLLLSEMVHIKIYSLEEKEQNGRCGMALCI